LLLPIFPDQEFNLGAALDESAAEVPTNGARAQTQNAHLTAPSISQTIVPGRTYASQTNMSI
jgi:hypothetical protein